MIFRMMLLSWLRRILFGASAAALITVPACSYQYGVGIRCSETLSNCEIYTGVEDNSKSTDRLE